MTGLHTVSWRLTAQKYAIWAVLLGILYLVRHLFALIFLTFILAYIGNTATNHLAKRIHYRRLALVSVYLIFLIVIGGLAKAILPHIYRETKGLVKQAITLQQEPSTDTAPAPPPVEEKRRARRDRAEEEAMLALAAADTTTAGEGSASLTAWAVEGLLERHGRQLMSVEMYEALKSSPVLAQTVEHISIAVDGLVPKLLDFVKSALNDLFYFVLALLFSFLILWDLPSIRANLRSYNAGRSAAVYREIAPGLKAFGSMLGRAFEAQTLIAVVNTILSVIGLALLGVPSLALLACIVFFCSYIPVLGVFISTVPAALMALKAGGIMTVVGVVVMVLVVHAVEAYGLNPLIYGHHMRMHPVGVLLVLLVGEHLFGVWGLLLGVPVTAFFLDYVVKGKNPENSKERS